MEKLKEVLANVCYAGLITAFTFGSVGLAIATGKWVLRLLGVM